MKPLKSLDFLKYSPLVLLSFASVGHAEEFDASIGVTGIYAQSFVVGEDDPKEALPYLNLSYGMVRFNPKGLGIEQELDENNTVGAYIHYRFSPIDVDDNYELRNFRDRDGAVELAVDWSTKVASMDITTTLSGDVSGKHEGYEAKVKAGKSYDTQVGRLIPAVTVAYQSKDLVDYYYGVSSTESAASGYAEYEGDGAIVSRAELTHVFPFGDHWQTVTNVSYMNLGNEIKDSSIVERSDIWGGSLSVVYSF